MRKSQRWLIVALVAVLIAGLSASAGAASVDDRIDPDAAVEGRGDGGRNGDRDRARPNPPRYPSPSPAPGPPSTPPPENALPPVSGVSGKFDILLAGGEDPATRQWWAAPYVRDLYAVGISQVPGVGWTDGDRAGYRCAYMFLYQNGNENDIIGRVTFTRIAGYAQINDAYMAEFQRAYDGGLDYTDQSECPGPNTEYQSWDGADFRPQIFYVEDGQLLENRSYTNTTGDAIAAGALRFREYERITTPFTDTGGLSSCDDYCTVYERVTVLAYFDAGDGEFFPAVAVYYDSLSPNVSLDAAGPGGFAPSQPSHDTDASIGGTDGSERLHRPGWRTVRRGPR